MALAERIQPFAEWQLQGDSGEPSLKRKRMNELETSQESPPAPAAALPPHQTGPTIDLLLVGRANISNWNDDRPHYELEDGNNDEQPEDAAAATGNTIDEPEDEHKEEPEAMIEHLCLTQQYISLIKATTLENGGLDPSTIEQLRNTPEGPVDISEPDTWLSIDLFLATTNASEATYNAVRTAISACFPDTNVLSHHLVKKLVSQLSGVVSIVDDMCVNSCHAFTGPFADLDHCSVCGEARYKPIELEMHNKKIPRQQFHTIPLGPQLQALR
ncbi:hypothetical protein BDN71DRAFT_1448025 [Pleurotus eryngii]|uniref:Uncharacterized protein n=1 Tax=Pleurotus eryngii TaxID=5323 RepID=A0A9P5ZWA3_PLEER|nr:hypothetical protein BDN71DRAFT_1448025 [Pleurotus eryngii]